MEDSWFCLTSIFGLCRVPQVMLNDFGSAARTKTPAKFCGALEHAPLDVVNAWAQGKEYKPEPWHDLHMLVATAFQALMPCAYHVLKSMPADRSERAAFLQRFWQHHQATDLWKPLFHVAAFCDYKSLQSLFRKLAPTAPTTVNLPTEQKVAPAQESGESPALDQESVNDLAAGVGNVAIDARTFVSAV